MYVGMFLYVHVGYMYVYAGMWHVYTYVIYTLIPVHTSQTMYRSKRNDEHGIV